MRILITLFSLITTISFGQTVNFNSVYAEFPIVPKGLLEAVSWSNTHMQHLSNEQNSCTGMPQAYGIMGLHDDGQGYFLENGKKVAKLSGISVNTQKGSALMQTKAYAKAIATLFSNQGVSAPTAEDIRWVLEELTEIPDSGAVNRLARDLQTSQILKFMTNTSFASTHGFTPKNYDLETLYGTANYNVLFGSSIRFTNHGIMNDQGDHYLPLKLNKTADYGPALWNPAATCNFSSRNGVAISAITIHTVQGTYSGCISWFQNCSASVSAHYVIRSSDGQVTQMVNEADKAWHVGTENPYTIGYEHEGYVSDPSWYTMEMYTSSADLSRDVINSGYGIPAPRTYFGDASSTVETLGGCTKIKGHQHYANQTHTDPGINWDWELYYRLINNNPTIINMSAASGTFFDSGGAAADYSDDERTVWVFEPANAQNVTLEFTSFSIEQDWDYLFIYDGNSIDAPLIGVYTGNNSPGTIISSGGSLTVEFRSDCSTTGAGWGANWTTTLYDLTAPVTAIISPATWYTDDFSVQFTDTDTQSGIENRFYLAAENALTPDDWYSNGAFGFAYESFEIQDNNWFQVTGTYSLNNGAYRFLDNTEQNSNTYIAVDQNNGFDYLYEWDQSFIGSNTNQRAGVHFFCDNPNLPNRGNSYFIYLRENDDKIQIYSVDNDVFNLEVEFNATIDSDQFYNCKVVYQPVSGLIEVYLDNSFVGSWTDATPLQSGGFFSLRSGGCVVDFDNIKVFKSRSNSAIITAGTNSEFSIESTGAVPTGLITSVVIDSAKNVSTESSEYFLLDFTVPEIDFVHDGSTADIDTFTTATIEANWSAFDIHSDIMEYEYAIGTLPSLDNVVSWTSNGLSTACSEILASPIYDQVYHISIRATNNAGLSEIFLSNGQRYIDNLSTSELENLEFLVYPNPTSDIINVKGTVPSDIILIYDMNGKLLVEVNDPTQPISLSHLSDGQYNVMIKRDNSFVIKQLIIK